jgi:hypothetical protein
MIITFHKILLKKEIKNDIRGAGSKCGTDETVSWFPVGKSSRKTTLGPPSLKWVDNIKVFLEEGGWRHRLD